jgi:hypothetical protein
MAINNGYCTLLDFKDYGIPEASADNTDDAVIEDIIETASRWLDGQCGRHFYKTSEETRYYTGECFDKIFTDDIVSIATLATDGSDQRTYADVWAGTDYDLVPYNAALRGWPYTSIEIRNGGAFFFPRYRKAVKVVGVFGFPSVPDDVKTATLDLAKNIYQRRFGRDQTGEAIVTPAGVVITPKDVTELVKFTIKKYRRYV